MFQEAFESVEQYLKESPNDDALLAIRSSITRCASLVRRVDSNRARLQEKYADDWYAACVLQRAVALDQNSKCMCKAPSSNGSSFIGQYVCVRACVRLSHNSVLGRWTWMHR
jgi:hypothetical protein